MTIFILGSPWHAILVRSFIKKRGISNFKYIVEKSSDSSYTEILKILNTTQGDILFFFEWSKFKFGNFRKTLNSVSYLKEVDLFFAKSTTFHNSSEIVVFAENNILARLILGKYRFNNKLIKIEDGVLDYLEELKAKSKVRLLILGMFFRLVKLDNSYSLFDEVIMTTRKESVPARKFVPLFSLRNYILSIIKNEFATDNLNLNSTKKYSLLLIQSLSEDGVITINSEIELYKRYIEYANLINISVVIKPHPRSSSEKVNRLRLIQKELNDVIIFEKQGYLAEALICTNNFYQIVGIYSNTLAYSQDMFGLHSFTLINDFLLSILLKEDRRRMNYIQKRVNHYFNIKQIEY